MALTANVEAYDEDSDSNTEEVFSHLTHSELEVSLAEILEKNQRLHKRCKNLKQILVTNFEAHSEPAKHTSVLKEKIFCFRKGQFCSRKQEQKIRTMHV
jgi:hypothetical protein